MEKRVVFHSGWLPYALLLPQIAVTVIFFFWPAAQAVYYSFVLQDPFGLSTQWVWFENYVSLFKDENYLASFRVTAVFSLLVASSGIVISLLLATMADRVVRGAVHRLLRGEPRPQAGPAAGPADLDRRALRRRPPPGRAPGRRMGVLRGDRRPVPPEPRGHRARRR